MIQRDENEKMEDLYFDFQAEIGITKHMGALGATKKLITLANLKPQSTVLVIGYGAGYTPVYLVKQIGCNVFAIDKRDAMIVLSRQIVIQAGLQNQIDFRVADAVDLPFEDALFDAVLIESVNAFIEDKDYTFHEYMRVLKSGGKLVINEATWKQAPPEHVREYMEKFMNNGDVLLVEGWKQLFKKAGFKKLISPRFSYIY